MEDNDYAHMTLIDIINVYENERIHDYLLRFKIEFKAKDNTENEHYSEIPLKEFQEDYARLGSKISDLENTMYTTYITGVNLAKYKEQYNHMTEIVKEVLRYVDLTF
jgi:hypothetical protein